MAGYTAKQNQTNIVDETQLKPRITRLSEYIDENEDDADDDDVRGSDVSDDDDDDEDDDDDDDDDIASQVGEDAIQSRKQNIVAAAGGIERKKEKPKSRSRLGEKVRSVFSKKKPKSNPSSEAKLRNLQHKLKEVEAEKEVVQSKLEQMNFDKSKETEAVTKERDDLQTENTRLKAEIEDLATKLEKVQCEREEDMQRQNIAACIEMHQISGMLWKRGVSGLTGRKWRHRWFKPSNDGRLYYYRKVFDNAIPRGFIDIKKITEVQDLPFSQENSKRSCFNVVTPKRTYEIRAEDEEEKKRWLNSLDHLLHWTSRKTSFNEGKELPCTVKQDNLL